MKLPAALLLAAAAAVLSAALPAAAAPADRPNLLIIHTDEHSIRTLGCYRALMTDDQAFVWGPGNKVDTPHIDSLAQHGAVAFNTYASMPVCTPSRASLVTGLRPHATGAAKNGLHLKQDVPTFGKILRDAGYATSWVGKWHLAGHAPKYGFNIADNGGFTDNRHMMIGGHAPYFHVTPDGLRGINEKVAAQKPADEIVHLTDHFTDAALQILKRDQNQPFCLVLSIPDPHTPDHARPPYHTMFDHLDVQPPKTMAPEHVANKPAWATGGKNEAKSFNADALRQYFGMVKHIDDSVGRLLAFLDENNLRDNTIVVFTSDHGDMFFEHNRTNKSVPYEASARIAFVVRHPASIPAGKVIRRAHTNVDFAPTVLSLMGIDTDAAFHGEDLSTDFTGPELDVPADRVVYYTTPGAHWAVASDGHHKLVVSRNVPPYLFDLAQDPDELVNRYGHAGYTEIGQRLHAELLRQMTAADDPGINHGKTYLLQ